MDSASFHIQQTDGLLLLTGTQNQAEGTFFAVPAFVLIQPPEIELHLPLECRLKVPELELDRH